MTEGCTSYCKAYFWIVPAKVDGAWTTDKGELTLKQTYQNFTGTLKNGNVITPITDGKLKGDADHLHRRRHRLYRQGQRLDDRGHDQIRRQVASQARRLIATGNRTMTLTTYAARIAAISPFAIAVALNFAMAQPAEKFEPTVGQEGKDVVWVPTPQALVDKMLDMAKLTPNDIHYDLGSGDGRTVITAAKRGATAFGVEFNPKMVELSRANAEAEGVTGKATFVQGDIFKTDFSKANVITLFLLPELNERLRPTILDMKPGTRVVSNSFSMGNWQPDERVEVTEDCRGYCRAHAVDRAGQG